MSIFCIDFLGVLDTFLQNLSSFKAMSTQVSNVVVGLFAFMCNMDEECEVEWAVC